MSNHLFNAAAHVITGWRAPWWIKVAALMGFGLLVVLFVE